MRLSQPSVLLLYPCRLDAPPAPRAREGRSRARRRVARPGLAALPSPHPCFQGRRAPGPRRLFKLVPRPPPPQLLDCSIWPHLGGGGRCPVLKIVLLGVEAGLVLRGAGDTGWASEARASLGELETCSSDRLTDDLLVFAGLGSISGVGLSGDLTVYLLV